MHLSAIHSCVAAAKMPALGIWPCLTHVKIHVFDEGTLFQEAVGKVPGDVDRPAVGTGRVVGEHDGLVEPVYGSFGRVQRDVDEYKADTRYR